MLNQSTPSAERDPSAARERDRLKVFAIFALLGAHVGVWAVQLGPLSADLDISPGQLGIAVSVLSVSGILSLVVGGHLADRLGRKPVLIAGFTGSGAAFVALSAAGGYGQLLAVFSVYGLLISFVDIGANAIGSDCERATGLESMTLFHACFSAGACCGALASGFLLTVGVGYRAIYFVLGILLIGFGTACLRLRFLPVAAAADKDSVEAHSWLALLKLPALALALGVIAAQFFGDGVLESFTSVYIQRTLDSTVLLAGVGIAAVHFMALCGRLLAGPSARRWGSRTVIILSGCLCAGGIVLAVWAPTAQIAVAGLALTGLCGAPVAPLTFSMVGRIAGRSTGRAVSMTTAVGYSMFILSPTVVGAASSAESLQVGISLLVGTYLLVATLGLFWPERRAVRDAKT